jgi:hypothetical protein
MRGLRLLVFTHRGMTSLRAGLVNPKRRYYELGPPNLHAIQRTDKQTELVWDMTIDRMPGQADEYGLLPLTCSQTCRLLFVARQDGIIESGKRIGCM